MTLLSPNRNKLKWFNLALDLNKFVSKKRKRSDFELIKFNRV